MRAHCSVGVIPSANPSTAHHKATHRDVRAVLASYCATTDTTTNSKPLFHLLADSAYPQEDWCIVPYTLSEQAKSQSKFDFNRAFCNDRVHVENAFGKLKMRWKIVADRLPVRRHYWNMVVLAAMMLTNRMRGFPRQ